MTDAFCVLPFMHLAITPDGGVRPCPRYGTVSEEADDRFGTFLPEKADRLAEAFHGPSMGSIREEMLAGKVPVGCLSCHRIENSGAASLRTGANARFGRRTAVRLRSVEVAFTNVCNLKCRSCNPTNASKLHREAVVLGEDPGHPVRLVSGVRFDSVDLADMERIKFYGGEPLLHQGQMADLLERIENARGGLGGVAVDVATNGTILPTTPLAALLARCGRVEWQFSVDATGALNDYMRDGSSFDGLAENLAALRMTGQVVMPYTTVSIMNVNMLPVLEGWLGRHHPGIYHHHFVAVAPAQIAVRNLPDTPKAILLDRYRSMKAPHYRKLVAELERPARIAPGAVVARMRMVDKLRSQSFAAANPEMAMWLDLMLPQPVSS